MAAQTAPIRTAALDRGRRIVPQDAQLREDGRWIATYVIQVRDAFCGLLRIEDPFCDGWPPEAIIGVSKFCNALATASPLGVKPTN